MRSYVKKHGLITTKADEKINISEKDLIASRLFRKNIVVDDNMSICPKHRSSFGVDWYSRRNTCDHTDHEAQNTPMLKNCPQANLTLCSKIEGFPIGGQ